MCKCKLRVHPIPENYTGLLTLGQSETVTDQDVIVFFEKAGFKWRLEGNIISNQVTANIPEEATRFFSCNHDCYHIGIRDANDAPIKFSDSVKEYDCLEISFEQKECDLLPAPRTLIINTDSPCTEC